MKHDISVRHRPQNEPLPPFNGISMHGAGSYMGGTGLEASRQPSQGSPALQGGIKAAETIANRVASCIGAKMTCKHGKRAIHAWRAAWDSRIGRGRGTRVRFLPPCRFVVKWANGQSQMRPQTRMRWEGGSIAQKFNWLMGTTLQPSRACGGGLQEAFQGPNEGMVWTLPSTHSHPECASSVRAALQRSYQAHFITGTTLDITRVVLTPLPCPARRRQRAISPPLPGTDLELRKIFAN